MRYFIVGCKLVFVNTSKLSRRLVVVKGEPPRHCAGVRVSKWPSSCLTTLSSLLVPICQPTRFLDISYKQLLQSHDPGPKKRPAALHFFSPNIIHSSFYRQVDDVNLLRFSLSVSAECPGVHIFQQNYYELQKCLRLRLNYCQIKVI